jgi:hypothetical protein
MLNSGVSSISASAANVLVVLESARSGLDESDAKALCPSYRCEDGALLLGVVQPAGVVNLLNEPIAIDGTFVQTARQGRSPEARFRFAGPCHQCACRQWAGGRCGVIDKVLKSRSEPDVSRLPDCSIRPACRWFLQRGAAACHACPEVVTDLSLAYDANDAPSAIAGISKERPAQTIEQPHDDITSLGTDGPDSPV